VEKYETQIEACVMELTKTGLVSVGAETLEEDSLLILEIRDRKRIL